MNLKTEFITIGKDKWEVSYIRNYTSNASVYIKVSLLRPNRKWYQSKYTYINSIYCTNDDEIAPIYLRERTHHLITQYYNTKEIIDNLFKDDNKNDDI